MKQYVLLDWDGNLAQTLQIWLEVWRAALSKRGFYLSDAQFGAHFGTLMGQMPSWGISDPEAIWEDADKFAKKKLPGADLYPDALEVLERLHEKNKKLALVTSALRFDMDHLLKRYDIAQFFDVIITHDDVAHHKPHPESLEKALSILSGNKEQAIMIGDTDKDIEAANNAGIESILFYPPEHERFYNLDKFKKSSPTYVVRDFKEILDIV